MRFRAKVGATVLLFAAATAAQAQQPKAGDKLPYAVPEEMREVQRKALEYQRDVLIAMVDSMPERLFNDASHPGQRDFAQQIHHAASAQRLLLAALLEGARQADPRDDPKTIGIYSRQSLRTYIRYAFDYSIAQLQKHAPEHRGTYINFFGKIMPGWQLWDEIHTHTMWTAGQVVGNFRKHGMAPPQFTFF
jgi:hypothetical protein